MARDLLRATVTMRTNDLRLAIIMSSFALACSQGNLEGETVTCGDVWQPTTLMTASDIPPLLVGKWTRCGGGEPASLASPFEFAADGTWYQLAKQSDGSTVRMTGSGQAGTWALDEASDVNTAGRLFVYPNNTPGSALWATVSFMLSPRVMQFDPALYAPLP